MISQMRISKRIKTFKCVNRCMVHHEYMKGNAHKNEKVAIWFHEWESRIKPKHLNFCIGAWFITNSSMGTYIEIKRFHYGFTNGNPQKIKTFNCLHRCMLDHKIITRNPHKSENDGIWFHE